MMIYETFPPPHTVIDAWNMLPIQIVETDTIAIFIRLTYLDT